MIGLLCVGLSSFNGINFFQINRTVHDQEENDPAERMLA